jgi:hypothetical protein
MDVVKFAACVASVGMYINERQNTTTVYIADDKT